MKYNLQRQHSTLISSCLQWLFRLNPIQVIQSLHTFNILNTFKSRRFKKIKSCKIVIVPEWSELVREKPRAKASKCGCHGGGCGSYGDLP